MGGASGRLFAGKGPASKGVPCGPLKTGRPQGVPTRGTGEAFPWGAPQVTWTFSFWGARGTRCCVCTQGSGRGCCCLGGPPGPSWRSGASFLKRKNKTVSSPTGIVSPDSTKIGIVPSSGATETLKHHCAFCGEKCCCLFCFLRRKLLLLLQLGSPFHGAPRCCATWTGIGGPPSPSPLPFPIPRGPPGEGIGFETCPVCLWETLGIALARSCAGGIGIALPAPGIASSGTASDAVGTGIASLAARIASWETGIDPSAAAGIVSAETAKSFAARGIVSGATGIAFAAPGIAGVGTGIASAASGIASAALGIASAPAKRSASRKTAAASGLAIGLWVKGKCFCLLEIFSEIVNVF